MLKSSHFAPTSNVGPTKVLDAVDNGSANGKGDVVVGIFGRDGGGDISFGDVVLREIRVWRTMRRSTKVDLKTSKNALEMPFPVMTRSSLSSGISQSPPGIKRGYQSLSDDVWG